VKLEIRTLDGQVHTVGTARAAIPCFRCGFCCIGLLVKLETADIRIMARGLGMSDREFRRHHVSMTPVGPVLRQVNNKCVFLGYGDRNLAKCSVYNFRPEVCRTFVPSPTRPECLEGLRRLGKADKILACDEIYSSPEDTIQLYSIIDEEARNHRT
jgi:Fe-S-cluster containining protein